MTNNFNIPTEYLTDDEMAKVGEIVNRLDDLNKRAPIVEFNNLKGQMIAGGSRGANLEFALDNLARRLGIERPDK